MAPKRATRTEPHKDNQDPDVGTVEHIKLANLALLLVETREADIVCQQPTPQLSH